MVRDLIADTLRLPTTSIAHTLDRGVREAYADRFVLQTEQHGFGLETWLKRTGHTAQLAAEPFPLVFHAWRGPGRGLTANIEHGRRTIEFEGDRFEVIDASWTAFNCANARRWWIGADRARVERFAAQVAEVSNRAIEDEVLVYNYGQWQRDPELRESIRATTFESLILPDGLGRTILEDFRTFLGSRDEYVRYGVPWKRGALFLGPPGNGKTHCVKALLNALSLPCLYVRSFEHMQMPAQFVIGQVFERARQTAPCALVLEDLDALVNSDARSIFLNELDGFASNEGIVTIATTNHPERLDPAILDRPSRFDRKYTFCLPEGPERRTYLQWWRTRLEAEVPLDEPTIDAVAESTDGFSYAYLKELVFSSLVAWVSHGRARALPDVLREQTEALRAQVSAAEPDAPEASD